MPDWFYRTVSQPILFRLPAPSARDLALGCMGRLARLPFGPFFIGFFGHMRADPRLRRSLLETTRLWWSLLIAGTVAYTAAIAVHYAVGYLSFIHLLPAFGGFALLLLGLLLSYPFLCRKGREPV